MTGSRYRSISHDAFTALMTEMGFSKVYPPNTSEFVFERTVTNGPRPSDRFKVRVYSSIDVRTGTTRELGSDAIRVILFDTVRERGVLDLPLVMRTENALANTKVRARAAWAYVMDAEHHCDCGSLMVERTTKKGVFLGCTSYPECKNTRAIKE